MGNKKWIKAGFVVFFGIAAAVLGIVALLFPWWHVQHSNGATSCVQNDQWSWETIHYTCTNCLLNCPADDSWQSDCSTNFCKWTQITYQATRAVLGAGVGLVIISCILHLVAVAGKIRDIFAIGVMILAILCIGAALAAFSIGLPMAIRRDYVDQQQSKNPNTPSDLACPDGVSTIPGCTSFIGNVDTTFIITFTAATWGPDLGWILCCVCAGLALICSLLMCIMGPKWKK